MVFLCEAKEIPTGCTVPVRDGYEFIQPLKARLAEPALEDYESELSHLLAWFGKR